MPEERKTAPAGTAPALQSVGQAAGKALRLLAGWEPDPVTRRLVELYLMPLGYTLRWVEGVNGLPAANPPPAAFLLSANAPPAADAAAIQGVAKALGSIPLLGLAGDRRPFPAGCVPHPIRRTVRKPIRSDDLLAALEDALGAHKLITASPLDGFAAMIQEMGLDDEMIADLCRSFIERGEQYLEETKAAAEPRDNEQLDRIAHGFKGMAGNMRLKRMTDLAEGLRLAAKHGNGDIAVLTRELRVEFSALRTLLHDRWLKPPPGPPRQ